MLSKLGNTAQEVADTLRKYDIKGLANSVRTLNPIVRYVTKQIRVDVWIIDVIKGDAVTLTFSDWRKEEIPMPEAVQDFLRRFNRGEYPDMFLTRDGTRTD